MKLLIILTGLPGTGKTILAQKIGKDLCVATLGRDYSIKESMFDTLGFGADREWSKKLGRASYDVLFKVLDGVMLGGQPVIVESNFTMQAQPSFVELIQRHGYKSLLVNIITDDNTRKQRLIDRVKRGERHPGHSEVFTGGIMPNDPTENLQLPGNTVEIDTTSFGETEYATFREQIRAYLSKN